MYALQSILHLRLMSLSYYHVLAKLASIDLYKTRIIDNRDIRMQSFRSVYCKTETFSHFLFVEALDNEYKGSNYNEQNDYMVQQHL